MSRRSLRAQRSTSLAAALALICATMACSAGKPEVVPSVLGVEPVITVSAIDNRYDPEVVEIEVGQAVRWVFAGSMEHDVVAEDGSFVSELRSSGEYVHVFEEAGEFAYDCSVHPEMTGTVIVR